jgi:hypothetical protein
MRIPKAVEDLLLMHGADVTSGPASGLGRPGASGDLVTYLAEVVFARKLGCSLLLEEGRLTGSCRLGLVDEADVDDPGGTGISELTRMFTIEVTLSSGADLIPKETSAYCRLQWVDAAELIMAWRLRDAQLLYPDANPLEICIRGLCIRSGVVLLEALV